MGYTEYYEARSIITEIISKDLLGPVEENEIICGDRPLDYYILGKLYPVDTEADVLLGMSSDDCGELDEAAKWISPYWTCQINSFKLWIGTEI